MIPPAPAMCLGFKKVADMQVPLIGVAAAGAAGIGPGMIAEGIEAAEIGGTIAIGLGMIGEGGPVAATVAMNEAAAVIAGIVPGGGW